MPGKDRGIIMDERIKQGYHKIYSEMFTIILFLAAGSVIVNVAFFHRNITQLWFEYVILIGSPIYRLVRIRMLEIADAPAAGWKRVFRIRMIAVVMVIGVMFLLMSYAQHGKVNFLALFGFLIPFLVLFCLSAFLTKALQDSWKRRQEKKYGDEE